MHGLSYRTLCSAGHVALVGCSSQVNCGNLDEVVNLDKLRGCLERGIRKAGSAVVYTEQQCHQ